MKFDKNKFELLAPVGGMEHLRAAVQNGADAVYLGGKLFNARINANNFDDEELEKAIEYAHARDVKVYITMNTLLKDEELEDALEYASMLYNIGADALIVQDLGFASMVKKHIPSLNLHFSTQGTIYNEIGVMACKELGFQRVVLSRELSLEEIKSCARPEYPEIEVFVHGALCICYSGQCNMSRINGGRSGNRGLCAQPCRLKYLSGEGEKKHWLSPKDLSAIDRIGDLIEAGVKSFKIEGRMKSPEYVALVTRIYRKYIDEYCENGYYSVSEEDRKLLAQIFNRGGFTNAYIDNKNDDKMMAFDMPKHRGIYIGNTIRRVDQNIIEIKLAKGEKLNMGDGIEIHNEELSGNVITYLRPVKSGEPSQGNKKAKGKTARNGEVYHVGDIKGKIRGGERVYKITDKNLMQDLRQSFASDIENDKCAKKLALSMYIRLKKGESAYISASLPDTSLAHSDMSSLIACHTFEDVIPEEARTKPLDRGRIEEQLSKCGEYPFYLAKCKIEADEGITIPISALNKMRREILAGLLSIKLRTQKPSEDKKVKWEDIREALEKSKCLYDRSTREIGRGSKGKLTIHLHKAENSLGLAESILGLIKESNDEIAKIIIKAPIEVFLDGDKKADLNDLSRLLDKLKVAEDGHNIDFTLAPYIPNITKGEMDRYLIENEDRIKSIFADKSIYVGNIAWAYRLSKQGLSVIADFGLNLANSEAHNSIKETIKLESTVKALEFDENTIGRVPLMVSEHEVKTDRLEDMKKHKMDVMRISCDSKTLIVRSMEEARRKEAEARDLIHKSDEITIFH